MKNVKELYERFCTLPPPARGIDIGDFPLYEALLAGCAHRIAHGYPLDLSTVPCPDEGTLNAERCRCVARQNGTLG